jgi:translation initiation factor 5
LLFKAQRYLLGGIEQFVHKKRGVLLSKTAHIIKALYDNDICEEEVIMSWGSKVCPLLSSISNDNSSMCPMQPSGKFVSKDFVKEMIKVAQPVLKWLEEAEEGSDEEEDDDKDLAVAFDDRSRAVGQTVVVEKPQKATGVVGDEVVKDKNNKNAATAKEANHEENDIDIDDI